MRIRAALIIAAAAALAFSCTHAMAQRSPELSNPQVEIAYGEPRNSDYRAIYERLRKREVLEDLRAFLSPLLLTRKVLVQIDECGAMSSPYQPGGPVTICYEIVAKIESLAPQATTPGGITRENAIVGAFVHVVLHEFSHAVFDILKLPVFGRENDAADKLAAFIMLQFGKEVALRTLMGSAWFFEASKRTWTGSDFSDVAGTEEQRFYNALCMAYGSDPQLFTPLVRNSLLKTRRALWCSREYNDLRFAFNKSIMPHVDPDVMKKVQSIEWLRPDDGKGI